MDHSTEVALGRTALATSKSSSSVARGTRRLLHDGRNGHRRSAHRPPARAVGGVVAGTDPLGIFASRGRAHSCSIQLGGARKGRGRPAGRLRQEGQGAGGFGKLPDVVVPRCVLAEQASARLERRGRHKGRQHRLQGRLAVPHRVVGHDWDFSRAGGGPAGDRSVSGASARARGGMRRAGVLSLRGVAGALSCRFARDAAVEDGPAAGGAVQDRGEQRGVRRANHRQVQRRMALDLVRCAGVCVGTGLCGLGAAASVDLAGSAVWNADIAGTGLRAVCGLAALCRLFEHGCGDELRLVPGGHARHAEGWRRGLHLPGQPLARSGGGDRSGMCGGRSRPHAAVAHGDRDWAVHAAVPQQRLRRRDLRGGICVRHLADARIAGLGVLNAQTCCVCACMCW